MKVTVKATKLTKNYDDIVFHKIAANGLGICDGALIGFRQLSFVLKLNRITEVEHLKSKLHYCNNPVSSRAFLFT